MKLRLPFVCDLIYSNVVAISWVGEVTIYNAELQQMLKYVQ